MVQSKPGQRVIHSIYVKRHIRELASWDLGYRERMGWMGRIQTRSKSSAFFGRLLAIGYRLSGYACTVPSVLY